MGTIRNEIYELGSEHPSQKFPPQKLPTRSVQRWLFFLGVPDEPIEELRSQRLAGSLLWLGDGFSALFVGGVPDVLAQTAVPGLS